MNRFVAWALVISATVGIIGTAFSYDVQFSDAMNTLAGCGFYIFGIWGAVLLFKK